MSEENKKHEIVYDAGGQEVKLSPSIVSQFITKGNANITFQEAINFMNLCKYSGLNPFLNEAYLIKYSDDKPADMVVSKEALMKRANRQENFQGYKAGVIVEDKEGNVINKKGQFVATKEKLVGGWATVWRSDLEHPFEIEVGLDEYNTYKSTWKKMPANMIRKVALATALREAFPEVLSSMKTDDEPNDSDHASGFSKDKTIEKPKDAPSLLESYNKEEAAEQAKKKLEEKKAAEEAAEQAEKEAAEKAAEAKKKEEEEKKAAAEEEKKKKAEEKKAAAEKKKTEAAAKKKAEADKKKEEESKTTDNKKGVNEEVEQVETETVNGVETTNSDDTIIDVEFEEVEGDNYDERAEQESLFKGLGLEPN